MKFLKSQGIVLVLAAVAVILVGKNLVWPFLGPKFAKKETVAQAPVQPASAPVPAIQKPSSPLVPRAVEEKLGDALKAIERLSSSMIRTSTPVIVRMDLNDLRARGGSWVVAPVRDPFKLRGSLNDKSAREQITLTGILRQTDSDLAVLNNQIVAVGETILGFRIETVEADRVWVSGPNGREALEFKIPVPNPAPKPQESSSADPIADSAEQAPRAERIRSKAKEAIAAAADDIGSGGLVMGEESGHWIESVMDSGSFIRLEDGSIWGVSPLDASDSTLWLPISNITIIEGDDASYPYKLINIDDDEVVNAKLLAD